MRFDDFRRFCLSLPEATEDTQWGALLFRIRKKIFATYELDGAPEKRITFKCTPERCAELLEREGVERAPYVGRYHWVAVRDFSVLKSDELRESVRQSYEMAAAKAPRKTRDSKIRKGKKSRARMT
jgi:predicted DNA-binding protein (MmcQ/YjbR family)